MDDGLERVIAYASRSNNKHKRNYPAYHGECMVALWVVLHFRPYLHGRPFQLVTLSSTMFTHSVPRRVTEIQVAQLVNLSGVKHQGEIWAARDAADVIAGLQSS